MPDSRHAQDDAHREAEELIPWYATGQLDPADRTIVERHLVACARCQRQLAGERRLIEEFQAFEPQVESSWERLRARIETRAAPRRRLAEAAAEVWGILTRPAVAALATAQVAFVALAAWLLPIASQPAYQALGSSRAPASANVIVIFRADATEEEIRGLLNASGATLVGGPTSADAYLLNVPANQRTFALRRLQSDKQVQMAQPIDGPA